MARKRWRVENLKKSFDPFGALLSRNKRSEASHSAHTHRLLGPQVVVQAELELGIPARLKPPATALSPLDYKLPILVRSSDHPGYVQQRLVGSHQDRAGQNVLHQEWM